MAGREQKKTVNDKNRYEITVKSHLLRLKSPNQKDGNYF